MLVHEPAVDDADHAVALLLDWATIDASSRMGPNRILVWQETARFQGNSGWTEELDHIHIPAGMAATMYVSPGAREKLERLIATVRGRV